MSSYGSSGVIQVPKAPKSKIAIATCFPVKLQKCCVDYETSPSLSLSVEGDDDSVFSFMWTVSVADDGPYVLLSYDVLSDHAVVFCSLVSVTHSVTVRWLSKNAESACSLCDYTHFLLLSLQIEAGQYCTFVISSDGSVRACGKGSYGRLGLGDSNNQSTLKKLTFEPHRAIKKVSSSKGSDGHTLAFTTEGEVFSWGDGDYGKLGHGNSSTQKYPKLIQGPLQGKVRFQHPSTTSHTVFYWHDAHSTFLFF